MTTNATAADLRALAARVCSEPPSRELHKDIARALGIAPSPIVTSGYGWREDEHGWWYATGEDARTLPKRIDPKPWLRSLDAAASLMPEGWAWGVANHFGGAFRMYLESTRREEGVPDVSAPTEPQARTAAALLAMAADMEGP